MPERYLLSKLTGIWLRRGFKVEVGASYAPDADVCVLHHDLSRLEPSQVPSPPLNKPIINGAVFDISKRLVSSLAIGPNDNWAGPVIIKTVLNHFGGPETKAFPPGILERLRRGMARFHWQGAGVLPGHDYPVLTSTSDVPGWVWSAPDLIVEKFLPERTRDGLYSVRGWVFLGDRGYAYRVFSWAPVVKMTTRVRVEYLSGVPSDLVALRDKMNFDYGKFDYVEHEGRAILLDANKTPCYRGDPEAQRIREIARGIEPFLQAQRAAC